MLDNMLLSSEWVNKQIKEEIKQYLKINEIENNNTKIYGSQQKAVLRGKFIAIQTDLKKHEPSFFLISNKQSNLT